MSLLGTVTDIQIIGGVYGGANTLPNFQSYGISIAPGTDYIQVIGTNTRGNVSGGTVNASTGTHNVIANNI